MKSNNCLTKEKKDGRLNTLASSISRRPAAPPKKKERLQCNKNKLNLLPFVMVMMFIEMIYMNKNRTAKILNLLNMKKKKNILSMLSVIVIAICVAVNLSFEEKDGDINFHLFNTEALAGNESGPSQSGYLSNPQDCTVTERGRCTIDLHWLIGCTVGFEYTLEFAGRLDDCQYTGGPTYCTPYACRKN